MKILEFGNKNNNKIIFIHGFQSPYQIWEEYINYFKKDFNIIVPILDGHNQEEKKDFISFDKTVKELEEYLLTNHVKKIYAIYAMSMGGVVATKLLESNKINIEKLILESTPLLSYGKIMTTILTNQYIKLTNKTKNRDKKTLLQATKSIITEDKLDFFLKLIDNMDNKTIRNYIKEIGKYKLPKSINTKTEIYYFHGTTLNEILAKKTAKYIKKNYKNSNVICLKGKNHCENALLNPSIMIKELNKILKH